MAATGRRTLVLGGLAAAAAFLVAGGISADDGYDAFVERARVHYAKVERELAAADVSALTPSQREARTRAIEALRTYRVRGVFGVNGDSADRDPYFVDDGGRRCAVAQILHTTGEDAVVERVARTANHAWVADLAGDAEFRTWLDRNGLTLAEAARIQVPGYNARQSREQRPPSNGGPDAGPPPKKDENANGRPNGSSQSEGGSSSVGGAGGTARGARSGESAAADAGSWWLWWECNKLDYLEANPLRLGGARATDAQVAARRVAAEPVLAASLSDPDAVVRGAAAVALGRVAGASAVARLVPLLSDADRSVRERAILAIGATGSAAGADVLLDLAQEKGSRKDGAPGSETRALAILALAISHRYGLDASFDARVADLVADAKKRDLADVGTAALVHRLLAGGTSLDAEALRAALDENAPAPQRARAVEALGRLRDKRAPAALRNAVGDSRVDTRRSAAIALGDVPDNLSIAQLKTAYELETEPLTRGFLLLSLGRAGDLTALDFLRTELVKGPEAIRPWAALGLGLAARPEGDIEARAALRSAKLPASAQSAVWIAQGLARDRAAVPALAAALANAASPPERADAASALALIADDESHAALLAACGREKSEFVRVVATWGLGSMGRDADAAVLLATVETVGDPELGAIAAVALGFHGGQACLDGALARAADPKLSATARAAAIEATGLMLSRAKGLVLHEVSRRTNFTVMPRWLKTALGVTL
jgi:HEAT repeat protein